MKLVYAGLTNKKQMTEDLLKALTPYIDVAYGIIIIVIGMLIKSMSEKHEVGCKRRKWVLKFDTNKRFPFNLRTDQHNINIRADKRQTNSNHRYNEQIARQTNNNQCNGSAIDFSVRGVSVIEVCRYCESIGVKCIIQYPGWTHIDNRNSRFFSRNSGQSATNSFN